MGVVGIRALWEKIAGLFSLNMLVGTEAGSAYNEAEYAAWLHDAGFENVRRVHLSGPTDLVIAQRPAG